MSLQKEDVTETSYLFDGLRGYTMYTFSIAIVFSNKTVSEYSYKIQARTMEGCK